MPLIEDRYELLEVIASGGMATVWKARDTRLDRLVAVKRPHPTAPGDERANDRMIREARAAAASSHPNLITIHDHGADEEGPYLVMELAEGPTLHDAMGGVTGAEALSIGAQIADGLAAIHDVGVIHRDVKPSNVILTERGPLLTDFGIALDPTATTEITEDGLVIATPTYAAPEVIAGGTPTRGSDVYSLAIVIEEMLDASGAPTTPDVEAALRAAKAETPDNRPDARAFAEALRGAAPTSVFEVTATAGPGAGSGEPTLVMEAPAMEAMAENPDPTAPSEGRRRSPTALLLGGALVILLAMALALALSDRQDPEAAVPTTIAIEETTTTTTPPTTSTTLSTISTTLVSEDPVGEARERLQAILLEPPRSDLNTRDVEKLMEDVDKAISRALEGERDKAADDLEKVAEEIDDKVEGSNRDRALIELSALADALGLEVDMPEPDD